MNYRSISIFVLMLANTAHAADTLRPFTTDGCILFPNGTPEHKNLWLQCCVEHDHAYWLGGTYQDRVTADKRLKQCVSSLDRKFIAEAMKIGVRVGGSPWLPFPFRWGYGWPYGRGYQAVSEGEERLALTLMASPVPANQPRPAHWAQPIQITGAPNLHHVSSSLYRSAQPTAEGMRNLQALGIRTVINLRAFHADNDELAGINISDEHISMKTWHPEREDVVRFLRIATAPERQPVLVHCQHGADRTGSMIAIYRVAVQGWNMDEAVQEMTKGGFGFHEVWVNLVPWLHALDIESLQRDAGLPLKPAADQPRG